MLKEPNYIIRFEDKECSEVEMHYMWTQYFLWLIKMEQKQQAIQQNKDDAKWVESRRK